MSGYITTTVIVPHTLQIWLKWEIVTLSEMYHFLICSTLMIHVILINIKIQKMKLSLA